MSTLANVARRLAPASRKEAGTFPLQRGWHLSGTSSWRPSEAPGTFARVFLLKIGWHLPEHLPDGKEGGTFRREWT